MGGLLKAHNAGMLAFKYFHEEMSSTDSQTYMPKRRCNSFFADTVFKSDDIN